MQLTYGTKGQIQFASANEFYEGLGFLAKNDGITSIHWENNENQGAWGSEGRIHCYKEIAKFPNYFSSAFTAGNGGIIHRINCNEYIQTLVTNHSFVYGSTQTEADIRATVPEEYIEDYERGLAI